MRQNERGFTIIEIIVAISIMSIISLAATMSIFQSLKVTALNNNHMTLVNQVQSAGYWISRDAQMAESITTANLSGTDFLHITWTERDYSGGDVYHSVTYFFNGLSGGIGKLKRNHWNSEGKNDNTLVAEDISYDPSDPTNTSNISYQNRVLTIKLTAISGDASETREYQISRRQNFN